MQTGAHLGIGPEISPEPTVRLRVLSSPLWLPAVCCFAVVTLPIPVVSSATVHVQVPGGTFKFLFKLDIGLVQLLLLDLTQTCRFPSERPLIGARGSSCCPPRSTTSCPDRSSELRVPPVSAVGYVRNLDAG
jgi:hypothetical protein